MWYLNGTDIFLNFDTNGFPLSLANTQKLKTQFTTPMTSTKGVVHSILYIKIFFSFFFIFPSYLAAQQNSIKGRIDSLLLQADNDSKKFNFDNSILLSKKALFLSQEISYQPGLIRSNYQIAHDLCNLGDYKKSFEYLRTIEKSYKEDIERDLDLKFKLTDLMGRNFLALGFRKQAVREFKKEMFLADLYKLPSQKSAKKLHSYVQLSACYEDNNADSTYYYLNKGLILSRNTSKQDTFIYYNLADYHTNFTKNIDSSFYYNNKAIEQEIKTGSNYLYIGFAQRSEILFQLKRYNESLEYCFKTIILAKKRKRTEQIIASYKLIADNYKYLGNYEKQQQYIDKYVTAKDSLITARRAGIQISADIIFEEEKEIMAKKNKMLLYAVLVGLFFIFMIITIVIISLKKKKERESNILIKQQTESEIIPETELRDEEFYDKIILLAKTNSPEFLFRFKQKHPAFFKKILDIQPDLKNSEQIFCAYLKLNFSTKEIANCTYVTPKAIQNRKNRIRKRLNIPSDIDIYIWFNEL